ncbi:RidA family protein [Gallaecimonas mangrovi]|uniref:RidA family protein n=1 Tax=Gallaecimonas mangrovi TaxID=2291597 RepID=UPI000E204680|nr:RidA family protein [Gallaecimonas mangrovi]
MTIHRINPTARWSDITVFKGIAHFVEVPECEQTDINSQVQAIFRQAEASLAQISSHKGRILSVTIYLTDFALLDAMNRLWDAWFDAGTAPSRACVKAQLADPHYLLEMAFVAAAGDDFSK